MSNIHIGIGLLGFGTVGGGIHQLLLEEGKRVQAKHGIDFEVKQILVRDPDRKRAVPLPKGLLARSFEDVVSDKEVDVIVEVMGGESPARDYILSALRAGKDVVTANKKLMASEGEALVRCARQHGRYFGFAGAVTGCHQFCSIIASSVMTKSIVGVLNGTSNFILSRMEDGLPFDDGVKEAQAAGYAEADPSEDVDGLDARDKLMILSRLAFGASLKRDQIPVTGIRGISKLDMESAKELGCTIKLLGISRLTEDGRIDVRVHPCFVPLSHQLSRVKAIDNGIQVYDELRGIQGMMAAGAGAKPTASAVVFWDLLKMAKREPILWPLSQPSAGSLKSVKPYSTVGKYYIRIQADNKPGVLAKISRVFARNKINITSVLQHESQSQTVPILIVCGPTEERLVKRALLEVGALRIASPAQFIRLADDLESTRRGAERAKAA